jgi:arylsulfatase A-like enzyme
VLGCLNGFGMRESMMRRRSFLLAPLAPLALAAAARPPNVMLVVASGWRAQAVPWAADADLIAPNLARFGRESVTFSRAYSGYPRLIPARRILFDGRFSHAYLQREITLDEESLGARLKAVGYRAARFGDAQVDEVASFVRASGAPTSPQPFYIEWSIEWTRASRSGGALIERPAAGDLRVPPNVPTAGEAAARKDLAQFYAQCTVRDRDFGIVMSALDRAELKDDTVVVFTSDRGELFGSHAGMGDDSPFEESVRIPLAMRHPRLGPAGERDILVSQADLAPTLLAFCGVPAPETMQGRNLSALIAKGKGERPDAVFAEGRIGDPDEWRVLVHGYDKLVTDVEGHPTRLYNLIDDPYEMNNLVNVSAEELKRDAMGALMQLWRRKLGDGRDASGLKSR